jgi:hypothetical protein
VVTGSVVEVVEDVPAGDVVATVLDEPAPGEVVVVEPAVVDVVAGADEEVVDDDVVGALDPQPAASNATPTTTNRTAYNQLSHHQPRPDSDVSSP